MRQLILAFVLLSCIGKAFSQNYPTKPVKLVGGFAPGGAVDFFARAIAQRVSERLTQPVVLEYRPGANGIIGAGFVAKSAPDGYTLLVTNISLAIFPSLFAKLPFDPTTDFAAVAQVASLTSALVVHPSVPARSVRELITLAKSRPGQLNYASAGNGTSTHLAAELFKGLAGVDIVSVPYNGAGPAVLALIGGQVELMFATLPSAMPQVRAGRMRALAVTSSQRSAAAPELPTVAEDGLPSFDVSSWVGIVAPAGTPTAIIVRLNQEINTVIQLAEMRELFAREGGKAVIASPEQFGSHIRSETEKWNRVIRQAGIKPQ